MLRPNWNLSSHFLKKGMAKKAGGRGRTSILNPHNLQSLFYIDQLAQLSTVELEPLPVEREEVFEGWVFGCVREEVTSGNGGKTDEKGFSKGG